jgi:hypothetical protein
MKKWLVCLVVLVFLFIPAIAMAEEQELEWFCPPSPCPDSGEIETWQLIDGQWVNHSAKDSSALARCWKNAETRNGSCNRENWYVSFYNHASVAQWCDWSISNTRWDWRVLKPGIYAADCITLSVKSNGYVNVDLSLLGDLNRPRDKNDGDAHGSDTNHSIETYYAILPETVNDVPQGINNIGDSWVPAGTTTPIKLEDSQALHAGLNFKLFNKITVKECNSVGEYHNSGWIKISLTNIKPWVSGSKGGWKSTQPGF